MNSKKLVVSNVSKSFEQNGFQNNVLNKINFSINNGEVVCLIGPNACGKTTLMQIVSGLIKPNNGKVIHNGEIILNADWNRTIIFQDLNLFPWKNVLENVVFGLKAKGLEKKEQTLKAKQYLNLLKIHQFSNFYPHQISGGTKQKVAIARALALEPDILLLDEPFSSLDMFSRELLQEELKKIVNEKNQTMLFVSHSIDEALFLADKIVILSDSPARVKSVIKVLRKHKKELHFRHSQNFLQYKKKIWGLLREEQING